jgi:hypothetical protein
MMAGSSDPSCSYFLPKAMIEALVALLAHSRLILIDWSIDWLIDWFHPVEKRLPIFACEWWRERKKEIIGFWNKNRDSHLLHIHQQSHISQNFWINPILWCYWRGRTRKLQVFCLFLTLVFSPRFGFFVCSFKILDMSVLASCSSFWDEE